MNEITEMYTALVNNIWEFSGDLQAALLKEFSKQLRVCNYESLVKYKAFIVYDNDMLLNYFNDVNKIVESNSGLYRLNGECIFKSRLVIPLTGFDAKVHGFVGYDNGNEFKDKLYVPYLYTNGKIFNKDKFCFLKTKEYIDAYNKGYICIVDGIFDKITLQSLGYNTVSILGSNFSKYHKQYFKYIKNWIVFADSDEAGARLYDKCKEINSNTIKVQVSNAKDIDERLRSDKDAKNILQKMFNKIKSEHFLFSHSIEEFV